MTIKLTAQVATLFSNFRHERVVIIFLLQIFFDAGLFPCFSLKVFQFTFHESFNGSGLVHHDGYIRNLLIV